MKIAIWHIVLERLDLISISLYIYTYSYLLSDRETLIPYLVCVHALHSSLSIFFTINQRSPSMRNMSTFLYLPKRGFFFSPSVLVVRDLLHWRRNALTSFQPQLAQGRPRQLDLALLDHRHWTNRKGDRMSLDELELHPNPTLSDMGHLTL